jgi:uncharacterized protein (DUF427 family)
MGLMTGTGPLSRAPAGEFNFTPPPGGALYLEPTPKRIRAVVGGETVAESTRALLLSETNLQPVYYFPPADVRRELLEPSDRHTRCPKKGEASYYSVRVGERVVENAGWYYPEPLAQAPQAFAGYIAFYWARIDEWWEEDMRMFVHPRDPYHRLDVLPSSRHVRISVDGELLAESRRPMALFESNLPPRWYLPREDVSARLVPSDSVTLCGYKGEAHYYSVELPAGELRRDLVWYYPDPLPEASEVVDMLCFLNEGVDIEVDGVPLERPATAWSRGATAEGGSAVPASAR